MKLACCCKAVPIMLSPSNQEREMSVTPSRPDPAVGHGEVVSPLAAAEFPERPPRRAYQSEVCSSASNPRVRVGFLAGLGVKDLIRHPLRSFGVLYLHNLRKHNVDNLLAGGASMVVSTIFGMLMKPYVPNRMTLVALTGVVSTLAFYAGAIPQWLGFKDRAFLFDQDGQFKKEGLYGCLARYATMFSINEPAFFTVRVGVLSGFLFGAPVLPFWISNPATAVLGLLSSYLWLPWLMKKSEPFQPRLERFFLKMMGQDGLSR